MTKYEINFISNNSLDDLSQDRLEQLLKRCGTNEIYHAFINDKTHVCCVIEETDEDAAIALALDFFGEIVPFWKDLCLIDDSTFPECQQISAIKRNLLNETLASCGRLENDNSINFFAKLDMLNKILEDANRKWK